MDLVLVLMSLFVASAVATNNLPQTIVPLIKSEMISRKKALLLVAVSASAGYLLQGGAVTNTVAHKLFLYQSGIFLASVIVASLFLVISTVSSISSSIQQLIILSLLGLYYSSGGWINYSLLYLILFSWIGNMLLTVLLVVSLSYGLRSLVNHVSVYNRAIVMNLLAVSSSILLAYAMGANTFGTISALFGTSLSRLDSKIAVVISIFYGVLLFNLFGELKKTRLREAFDVYHITCAQLGCGISVIFFSFMGIPVSIIHALFAGLLSLAFLKRMRTLERKAEMVLLRNLFLVPLAAFLIGLVLGTIFF